MKNEMKEALHRFVAQRSGIEWVNYGGSREAFMQDYRRILRDGRDARVMLGAVIPDYALADALKSALLQIFRYLVDVALSNEPPLRGCEPFPRKQSVSPKGFGEAYEISVLKSRNHRFLQ